MNDAASTMHTNVLSRAAGQLSSQYAGMVSAETVERYVFESYIALSRTAKLRTHLVNTAIRFANDRLRALAQTQGKIQSIVPQVLFVCVHNIGRSQIAAALMTHYAGDQVEVRSAGSLPASEVHPLVVEALNQRDLDLSEAYPKPLTDDVVRAADYVVTMGCGDVCPIYPGKRYLDWDIPDPTEETPEHVGHIVDCIDERVRDLLEQIHHQVGE